MTPADAALAARFRAAIGPVDEPLALAVSGGGDSVALLDLCVEAGLPVCAVTVDHGLRPEAAAEAQWVARLCARLGIAHQVLRWTGWDGAGNLQDQARRARHALISDWARTRGIGSVVLGHTLDDQAETVLMRLARRAGVDGLSGMAAQRRHLGILWRRPLLGIGREALRAYLQARGQDWIEDPSNNSLRFDRVRARQALAALAPLGIDATVLAGVAAQMAEARQALELQAEAAARAMTHVEGGDVVLDRPAFLALPAETRRRLLSGALRWVASAEYGPRAEPLQGLLAGIAAGRGGTLAGCRVLCRGASLRVTRELQAVRATVAQPGAPWDHRWRLDGPDYKGLQVRALGEAGLAACPLWRQAGLPRASLLSSPAVWRGDDLVAAPLAGQTDGWTAALEGGPDAFRLSLLSH